MLSLSSTALTALNLRVWTNLKSMREATETIQAVVPECGSHVVSVVPHDHEDILIFKGPVAEKRLHLLRNKFRGMLRVERRNVQSEILPFEIDEKMYGQADVGVIGPTRPDVCCKRKDRQLFPPFWHVLSSPWQE